ncbi:MAG: hypothetical protein ACXWV5_00435 [Flavitalea sp.]
MERLEELISKLKEQFEQKADRRQLLVITQMIEQELMRTAQVEKPVNITSKVSVVMPSSARNVSVQQEPPVSPVSKAVESIPVKQPELIEYLQQAEKEIPKVQQPVAQEAPKVQQPPKPVPVEDSPYLPKPPVPEILKELRQDANGYHYDPLQEVPTLSQQTTVREINEVMRADPNSLNDRLKSQIQEIGHKLTDSPIRDLKKAIGINDRYSFINELFRGDEVMYERSIKTINNFKILAEAEYWIQRELKVKIGWDESSSTVAHFDQLVRRRFL